MRAIVGAALGLAVWMGSAVVMAAPAYVRLSYTGDTASSMTVSWNTTTAAASEVKLGTSPGNYTQTVPGASFVANAGLGHVHEVTLTGLLPSTKYYYVAGDTAGGYSSEASFTTGSPDDPSCGKLRFAFVADNRPDPIFGGGQNYPQILAQAAFHQPAFVLNGGDMVIDGDQIDQWLTFLGDTEPVAKNIPFLPTIGNHDNGPGAGNGANYNQIFALPVSAGTNGSNTEDYYFFTYGNAIFVSLSTETYTGGSIPFATQAAWLDDVLTQNPKKWKFVFYHKPTYTAEAAFSISHVPNEANQNAALVPIFDKHHVDVVFASHNHWYERFEPSDCATQGTPGSDKPCSAGATGFGSGTVYVVSGGAGAFTVPSFLCGNLPGRVTCSGDHHYVLVDIENENLKLEAWGAFPQPNAVIDSVTIQKSSDQCAVFPGDAGVPDGSTGGTAGAGTAGSGSGGVSGGPSTGGGTGGVGTGGGAFADAQTGGTSSGGPAKNSAGDSGGCGCRTGAASHSYASLLLLLAAGLLGFRRR